MTKTNNNELPRARLSADRPAVVGERGADGARRYDEETKRDRSMTAKSPTIYEATQARDASIGAIEEVVATRLATHEIRQLMRERRWLLVVVEKLSEALRDISSKLDCDPPCTLNQVAKQCGSCGHVVYETWCAGCVARAALALLTAPEAVNDSLQSQKGTGR